MTLKLQIVASIFSLNAVITQFFEVNIAIDIEGMGIERISTMYSDSESMAEVLDLIRAKEYEKAITRLSINGSSDFCHQHLWLRGFCYLETGNIENATNDLLLGADRDPSNRNIIDIIQAEVLLSNKKYEEKAYNNMKTLSVPDLHKLGDRLCYKKKFDEALQCYSEAFIRIRNQDDWTPDSLRYKYHVARGNCYAKMEEFELSLADFKHANRLRPENSKGHDETDDGESEVLLILALFDAGFFDKSMKRMNDLKSEKDVVSAVEGILNQNINWDQALPFFSQAIEKFPGSAILYEKRGLHQQKMQKYEEAMTDFRNAKAFNSSLTDSWISLIKLLLLTGDHTEAKKVLKDFDKLAVPMEIYKLAELETVRLKVLRTKQEKKITDETEERN